MEPPQQQPNANNESQKKSVKKIPQKKKTACERFWIKLGLVENEELQWYKPFRKIKKQKIRKFKLIVISIYLLIVLLSLLLQPYIIVVLTNGLTPVIKQPKFAHAFKHYTTIFKISKKEMNFTEAEFKEFKRSMGNITKGFTQIFKANNRILFTTLLAIPVNVFFTLCLAFRFTRRSMNIFVMIIHFILSFINVALAGGVFALYKTGDLSNNKLLREQIIMGIFKLECKHKPSTKHLRDQIKDHPETIDYIVPIITILGVCAFLHLLLGFFFLIRSRVGGGNGNPRNKVKPIVPKG